MNLKCYFFFFVLFILSFLVAGCRSSRSGSSHSEVDIQYLKENKHNSVDFKNKLTRKLIEQDAQLRARIIEFYPPNSKDTTRHGPVKSITDLDFSSTSKVDSTVGEKQLICSSDTASEQLIEIKKDDTTYQIKHIPWYQPFIPYLVLAFITVIFYHFRKK